MDNISRIKTWRRLCSRKLYFNSIYIYFSFFLDAYAFSTEGIVGYAIGKKFKIFLLTVKNSIQLSICTD